MKTPIYDALDKMLYPIEAESVIACVSAILTANPEAIEELIAGKRLVDLKLSQDEVIEAMTQARVDQSLVRYERIRPLIVKARKKNPKISISELAQMLDNSAYRPQRSEKWSRASVYWLLTKLGMNNGSTEA